MASSSAPAPPGALLAVLAWDSLDLEALLAVWSLLAGRGSSRQARLRPKGFPHPPR